MGGEGGAADPRLLSGPVPSSAWSAAARAQPHTPTRCPHLSTRMPSGHTARGCAPLCLEPVTSAVSGPTLCLHLPVCGQSGPPVATDGGGGSRVVVGRGGRWCWPGVGWPPWPSLMLLTTRLPPPAPLGGTVINFFLFRSGAASKNIFRRIILQRKCFEKISCPVPARGSGSSSQRGTGVGWPGRPWWPG